MGTLGGAAAAAGLWRASAAEDPDLVTVSVLHTTDLHGHITPTRTYADDDGNFTDDLGGLARCATQIRAWQKENPNHVLLDIGDIYQGTHVSLASRGQLMMRLLNSMKYDAWIIGNHEFDWGLQSFIDVVGTSTIPVLGSNCKYGGKWVNRLEEPGNPLSKVQPFIVKNVAGFKIGIIGTVTPGLPFWLAPRLLGDFSAEDPVKSIDFAMKRLKAEKVDAIVLCSHMGLKGKGRPDDFANRINQIAAENVGIDVIIAGHTHKDLGNEMVKGVPYTQANYYGIHCGRVDLVFSKSQRKVMAVHPVTMLMDKSVEQDPMILSASAKEREASAAELQRPIGELSALLSKESAPGKPAETLLLLTRAMRHALEKRSVRVDAVLHGNFYDFDIQPGRKTIADAWEIVPYENYISTAEFTREELMVIAEECFNTSFSTQNFDGFKVTVEANGKKDVKVTDIAHPDGKPLDPAKRYRVALNSFDAQSGGRRYMKLREIVTGAEAKIQTHDIQSREALIEFMTEKKSVGKKELGMV